MDYLSFLVLDFVDDTWVAMLFNTFFFSISMVPMSGDLFCLAQLYEGFEKCRYSNFVTLLFIG